MGSKITIIGAGSVGATIAYTLSREAYVSEVVIIDVAKDKVDGEAMDIVQGTAFRDPVDVYAGDYEHAAGSDMVIITCGVARKPGQSRIDLAQTNVNIIKSIAPELKKYAPDALYIIVANPVDIMTYAFIKASGIPESQVMGSGTLLDTIRLRYRLSQNFKVSQKNIEAYVFGEHGDSSFIPWSFVNIAGMPMEEYMDYLKAHGSDLSDFDKEAIAEYVHKSGGEIIKRKGATFYGVTASVEDLVSMLNASHESITCVSSMMHGEYGVEDACLSCLTIVGPKGVKAKLPIKLTEEEVAQFQDSARKMKEVISSLDID